MHMPAWSKGHYMCQLSRTQAGLTSTTWSSAPKHTFVVRVLGQASTYLEAGMQQLALKEHTHACVVTLLWRAEKLTSVLLTGMVVLIQGENKSAVPPQPPSTTRTVRLQ